MPLHNPGKPYKIVLADDDRDEHFFFKRALNALSFPTSLLILENGELLMNYLLQHGAELPDLLFLDYNMPCRNGAECLAQIRNAPSLAALPVIMYSTDIQKTVVDTLYNDGAHFYIHKTDNNKLKQIITRVFMMLGENRLARPSRAEFVLNSVK